ncbi:MAG: hypothetical protein HY721_34900 [Planctomycetes bacterium]|nr:hypothetical protein [Planctomycetota bacterium]
MATDPSGEPASTPPQSRPSGTAGEPAPRPRRLRRRLLLLAASALAVLLAALVGLAPWLLSTPPGRRLVLSVASGSLAAPLGAEGLSLSWTGEQRVEGLRIGAPPGFPPEEDVLRARSVVVKAGLLGLLLSRRDALELEVALEEPVLAVHRDREGRINLEGLLRGGAECPGGPRGEPGEAPQGPGEEKEQEKRWPPGVRGLPVKLTAAVRAGKVLCRDDVLGTSSEVRDIEASLSGGPSRIDLKASAAVAAPGGGAGGALRLEASLRTAGEAGAGGGESEGPVLAAEGSAEQLDLGPFRGILEALLGLTPPEEPVTARFSASSSKAGVSLSGSIDAGLLRLAGPEASAPADPRRLLALPPGARAAAALRGTITLTAPGSVLDAGASGLRWLEGSRGELRLEARGVDGAVPFGDRTATLAREALSLDARIEPAPERAAVKLEADLSGEGLRARLASTLRTSEPAVPWEATIHAEAPLLLLAAALGLALPESLEVDPASLARVRDLRLEGLARGEEPLLESLRGTGRLEATGPLKLRGWSAEKLTAALRAEGGVFTAEGVEASVNGGRAVAPELTLDLRGPAPAYRGEVRLEGVAANWEMTPLLAYAAPFLSLEDREAELQGRLDGRLEIAGQGLDRESLERNLRGKGSLRIAEGNLLGSRVLGEAARLLGAGFGEVLFAELGSDFEIGSGKVETSRAFLRAREGGKLRNLGLAGHVRLDRRVDFGVDLGALEETVGDKRLKRILGAAAKVLGEKGFPLRLKGTLSAPELALEPSLGGLDLQGLEGLEEILKPGASKAGDGGVPLDDILDLFKRKKDRRERKERRKKEGEEK